MVKRTKSRPVKRTKSRPVKRTKSRPVKRTKSRKSSRRRKRSSTKKILKGGLDQYPKYYIDKTSPQLPMNVIDPIMTMLKRSEYLKLWVLHNETVKERLSVIRFHPKCDQTALGKEVAVSVLLYRMGEFKKQYPDKGQLKIALDALKLEWCEDN
jgi:hypothetical protein